MIGRNLAHYKTLAIVSASSTMASRRTEIICISLVDHVNDIWVMDIVGQPIEPLGSLVSITK